MIKKYTILIVDETDNEIQIISFKLDIQTLIRKEMQIALTFHTVCLSISNNYHQLIATHDFLQNIS